MFDDILELEQPDGVKVVAYVDDLAIVVIDEIVTFVKEKTNTSIVNIRRWLTKKDLELAEEKTEVVLITGKRNLPPVTIRVGEREVTPGKALKYLGIWIDAKMMYKEHIHRIEEKAGKTVNALSKLMANVQGPKASKRKVLASVINSILLYAAPVWGRTSDNGNPPIEGLAQERTDVYRGVERREVKERLWRWWQRKWEETSKGRWTRKLIPQLRTWVEREHGEVGYHVTQVLTNHGCFREYLYDIGKIDNRECLYCGEIDDAAHTVFHCKRWKEERKIMEEEVGRQLTPENLVSEMSESEKKYKAAERGIIAIISTKEREEREIEGEGERPNPLIAKRKGGCRPEEKRKQFRNFQNTDFRGTTCLVSESASYAPEKSDGSAILKMYPGSCAGIRSSSDVLGQVNYHPPNRGLRPDIVLLNKGQRRGIIIDIAVPLTHNIQKTEREKIAKLEKVAMEIGEGGDILLVISTEG
ncbi:hypothetical protein NQ318_016411 [Aromia moschata]|uniref:Reverse transcriptase domain-containing protein n=1 Tax=Aromia moschata TaxID=1265417 RepID=A0AAV8Z518_9CUCU|nr:hypothetical protein NQ318_016411 [Aromia moschata]